MTHRIVAIAVGDDWMDRGKVVGHAETRDEAIAIMRRQYPTTIIEGEGGICDFYDAEDAPRIYGIDADGTGAYGITYMTEAD